MPCVRMSEEMVRVTMGATRGETASSAATTVSCGSNRAVAGLDPQALGNPAPFQSGRSQEQLRRDAAVDVHLVVTHTVGLDLEQDR